MYEFKFPDVGEGIHEGTITKWLVKNGDTVKEDQPLVEMETAKAIVDIPSPKAGVILKRVGEEGATVNVGDVLVVIEEAGSIQAGAKRMPLRAGVVGDLPEAPDKEPGKSAPKAAGAGGRAEGPALSLAEGIKALPAVRKLAEKLNVNLASVKGTGRDGMITQEDILNAAPAGKMTAPKPAVIQTGLNKIRKYDMWGYVDRVHLKGIRKTIAEHTSHSYSTIPHVTHCDTCDVTALVNYRAKHKEEAAKKGIKLTFLPFIIKAVINCLQEFPMVNSNLDENSGDIIVKKYHNIGIAVDTEEGLMVPIVKGAGKKSILALAKEIEELAQKARSRKIDLMDLQGGSFTITNVGSIGGTVFTPIINTGQSAILGVAAIKDAPAVHDGKVEARKILNLCLTFDHRIIDGAMAARFLNMVMKNLSEEALFPVLEREE